VDLKHSAIIETALPLVFIGPSLCWTNYIRLWRNKLSLYVFSSCAFSTQS